jgi:hypothetical protein
VPAWPLFGLTTRGFPPLAQRSAKKLMNVAQVEIQLKDSGLRLYSI